MRFNNFKVKKTVVLIILLLGVLIRQIYGQVNFADPSLEEDYTYDATATDRWVICEGSPDKWIADQFDWMYNPDPSDGYKYLGLAIPSFWDADLTESLSNYFLDTLFQGVNYFFDFDIAYLSEMVGGSADYSKVDIYLGNGACDLSQKIAVCIAQDTIWETRRVNFTPDANYTSLTLRTEFVDTLESSYILIDNFSSIFNNNVSSSTNLIQPQINVSSVIGEKQFIITTKGENLENFNFCMYSSNGILLWQDIPLSIGSSFFKMDDFPIGVYIVVIRNKLTGVNYSYLVSII